MTHTTTEKLINQLGILHQLTNSETQIARNPACAGPQRYCPPTIHDERDQRAGTCEVHRSRTA